MYKIKVEKFEGPLALLLKLIEQEKLDITEVSLSHVADQFLEYVDSLEEDVPPAILADFLVIAARLLVIKSHVLLPSLTMEEEAEGDLEQQLRMYKAYRDASEQLRKMIAKKHFAFGRLPYKLALPQEFRPPENITQKDMHQAMVALITELEKTIQKLPKKRIAKIVSISERIGHLRAMFLRAKKIGFTDFLKTARNKSEVIVSFLALLELVKQRELIATQEGNSIHIQSK